MANHPKEKFLFSEIEKKLFYIVPEKWESIYLYASVYNVEARKTGGEMFFYYIPKGLIKKKPINGYEIPALFNIDEEEFSNLITDLYSLLKKLRVLCYKLKNIKWSNINIVIENNKLRVEYGFDDFKNSKYNSYERHVIWRYNNFDEELEQLSKKDKKIVTGYLEQIKFEPPAEKVYYTDDIEEIPMGNIVDYETTLSVDEAIAQSKAREKVKDKEKSKKFGIFKWFNKKKEENIETDDDENDNQLLKF